MTDIWEISRKEKAVLASVNPDEDGLVSKLYDEFHAKFQDDMGRDPREFSKLLAYYKGGTGEYRRGVDRALVTMTGFRLMSLIRFALGENEQAV